MIFRIKFLLPTFILPFVTTSASSQKLKKADQLVIANLDAHIRYLSDARLKGRQTGTPGEKMASDYISTEFGKIGLQPKGDNNGWLQAFDIDMGREVSADAYFMVNDHPFLLNKEYFPLAFSAVATVTGSPAIALQESGSPWFLDLRELLENGTPRSALSATIRSKAVAFAKKGATALILYNTSRTADNLSFDPNDKSEPVDIPVIYITSAAKKKYLRDESASVDIRVKIGFSQKKFTGHNVIGYLDNGAATTVIIGGHYDHCDSTGQTDTTQHNNNISSNDNAGGIAALIELARMLAVSRLKSNNYLFVAFSGEEQGCYGSKYFAGHPPLNKLNYMLDLDRAAPIDRDGVHDVHIGGSGSSPAWWGVCREAQNKTDFSYRVDSSYSNIGDPASFYTKEIPTLAFYTESANLDQNKELAIVRYLFGVIKAANGRGKLAFTKVGS
jgi:hypothetical protein